MEPWGSRAPEERYFLNPALVALLLRQVAMGHVDRVGSGVGYFSAFLAVPVVAHGPTRRSLPRTIATSLPAWLIEHPIERSAIASRVPTFAPVVQEGLLLGMRTGTIQNEGTRLVPIGANPDSTRAGARLAALMRSAQFVGRWIADLGSESTLFALWGTAP
jgi:hypothetical protein